MCASTCHSVWVSGVWRYREYPSVICRFIFCNLTSLLRNNFSATVEHLYAIPFKAGVITAQVHRRFCQKDKYFAALWHPISERNVARDACRGSHRRLSSVPYVAQRLRENWTSVVTLLFFTCIRQKCDAFFRANDIIRLESSTALVWILLC